MKKALNNIFDGLNLLTLLHFSPSFPSSWQRRFGTESVPGRYGMFAG
jgi:hypothetical protein